MLKCPNQLQMTNVENQKNFQLILESSRLVPKSAMIRSSIALEFWILHLFMRIFLKSSKKNMKKNTNKNLLNLQWLQSHDQRDLSFQKVSCGKKFGSCWILKGTRFLCTVSHFFDQSHEHLMISHEYWLKMKKNI